jgi:hypothetical protein
MLAGRCVVGDARAAISVGLKRVFLQPQRRVKPTPADSDWYEPSASPAVGLNA